MSILDMVSPMVDRYGQTVTYKQIAANNYNPATGENTKTEQTYTLRAAVREYSAKELVGLIQQGDRKVVIPAADLTITPKAKDQISISGKWHTVMAVNTRVVDDTPAVHIVQVRG